MIPVPLLAAGLVGQSRRAWRCLWPPVKLDTVGDRAQTDLLGEHDGREDAAAHFVGRVDSVAWTGFAERDTGAVGPGHRRGRVHQLISLDDLSAAQGRQGGGGDPQPADRADAAGALLLVLFRRQALRAFNGDAGGESQSVSASGFG